MHASSTQKHFKGPNKETGQNKLLNFVLEKYKDGLPAS
jgi:hypothetical protein